MEYTIERAKLGDEGTLAYIQTESWKAGFREILDEQTLQRCTQLDRATAMYRRLLEAGSATAICSGWRAARTASHGGMPPGRRTCPAMQS